MKKIYTYIIILFFVTAIKGQSLYYPPVNNSLAWETLSPQSIGWNTKYIDTLYNFLEQENTKAFIVLKDGKIVLEKYFGTFTADSAWYWASAGKTMTSFLVGKAVDDGYLSLDDATSKYLGVGWTACTTSQEAKITIRHQLTMTSGLDDGVADSHCTSPECLIFKSDAGSRWAYHNAPYTLLESVIAKASSQNINVYTQTKLKSKTGMTGLWMMTGEDNVFYSTARSMARFGLLAQDHFKWNGESLLKDTAYVRAMSNSSQNLNLSYGYLWWLNGKASYMLPSLQFVFQGSYAPSAPGDMFAGLGKNGQIVSISPSRGLVVVRMGNQPGSPAADIAPQLCNQIWAKLNQAIDGIAGTAGVADCTTKPKLSMARDFKSCIVTFNGLCDRLVVLNLHGKPVTAMLAPLSGCKLDLTGFPDGVYFVRLKFGTNYTVLKLLK